MNETSPGRCAIVLSIAATAAPWASSLQHTTTLAPAFTNSCAQPLPIPLLPPVTITTLSAYRKEVILPPPRVVIPWLPNWTFTGNRKHFVTERPIVPASFVKGSKYYAAARLERTAFTRVAASLLGFF